MRRLTGSRPRAGEDGSALMLVPAGVLVLILLGAIAIDSAVVMLAQRDLQHRTAAVANDAVALSVDEEIFYDEGAVRLSPERARTYAAASFSDANRPEHYRAWGVEAVAGDLRIEVRAWADVSSIFLKAIPGMAESTRVEARSVATAEGVSP